jgi:hypothetical protein
VGQLFKYLIKGRRRLNRLSVLVPNKQIPNPVGAVQIPWERWRRHPQRGFRFEERPKTGFSFNWCCLGMTAIWLRLA